MDISAKLEHAQKILDYEFNDIELLKAALTHPSALDEFPSAHSYERLEFLGDSVLGYIVARTIFEHFKDLDEGKLTRLKVSLVSGQSLSEVSEKLGIGKCIIFGASERGTGARGLKSALENVYEALLGAITIDGGLEPAARFVLNTLKPETRGDLAEIPENPKSFLQERIQRDYKKTPRYEIIKESGPGHKPTFVAQVSLDNTILGEGSGYTKKEAEVNAAISASQKLFYLDKNSEE
ncbi:MAG: ribonuclease III [Coriobacteriia bacterium]|nr:ribonuclease III [Coriobacteriia bacterium]